MPFDRARGPRMSKARALLDQLARDLEAKDEATKAIPEPSPPGEHRRLCIAMSTYDDFDGVYFTLQAIRMYHPEVLDDVSFLIVDNHPEGAAAEDLKRLDQRIPNMRYIPFKGSSSTAARDLLFRIADADIVMCLDSHVLLRPGALRSLLDYFDANPETLDSYKVRCSATISRTSSAHTSPRNGVAGCMGNGIKTNEPTMRRAPPSRSTCRASDCSRAGAKPGRASIPGSAASEARRATSTRRCAATAVECCACPPWGGRIDSPDRWGRPTGRRGRTACGTTALVGARSAGISRPWRRTSGTPPRQRRHHSQRDGAPGRQPVHVLRRHLLPQRRRPGGRWEDA